MFDTINARFWALPLWGRIAIMIPSLFALEATSMAWGSRSFITAWLQSYAAAVIYWGGTLGSLAVAIWAGSKVGQHTHRLWLGWVVGISMWVACIYATGFAWNIPDVGWRIKLMNETSSTADYY